MPVMSSNAWVNVLDSYSWVGMVSDSTLISMPAKGLAASMNHCISAFCSSIESVEGWNSSVIHFSAAAISAEAEEAATVTATAETAASNAFRILSSQLSASVFAAASRFICGDMMFI